MEIQMSHIFIVRSLLMPLFGPVQLRHATSFQGSFGIGFDQVSQHDRLRRCFPTSKQTVVGTSTLSLHFGSVIPFFGI
jgi:hypothetical protein